MKKKMLLNSPEAGISAVKEIAIFDDPQKMKMVLNKLTWKILLLLSEREMYPMELAKKLGIHEQKVYYHMRKLVKAGVVRLVKEEEKKGATAKYYSAAYPAIGIELPFGSRTVKNLPEFTVDEKLRRFFSPIVEENGAFQGKIVVGSPDPHGPFKTVARDGHYASHLAFFLGQFAALPDDFVVHLDVDIKAEKEERSNLILVGGPGTNLITQEINDYLPIRFNMESSQVNPWDKDKRIVVLAGNKAVGTKACVIAISKFWRETLKKFDGQERFATVIQGFDLDGDGKVDSIEVLE